MQVELPQNTMRSMEDLQNIPTSQNGSGSPMLGDLASPKYGNTYGEIDRLNTKRIVILTANAQNKDLGTPARDVSKVLDDLRLGNLGKVPRGMTIAIRGQLALMLETMNELKLGLGIAIVAIFLLLSANFQSFRLVFVVVSTLPAVLFIRLFFFGAERIFV